VDVLLLSNDAENRDKAIEIGLKTVSIEDYVRKMSKNPYLADKLLKSTGSFQVNSSIYALILKIFRPITSHKNCVNQEFVPGNILLLDLCQLCKGKRIYKLFTT
jgi:hypothetical protein